MWHKLSNKSYSTLLLVNQFRQLTNKCNCEMSLSALNLFHYITENIQNSDGYKTATG